MLSENDRSFLLQAFQVMGSRNIKKFLDDEVERLITISKIPEPTIEEQSQRLRDMIAALRERNW
jgi:hypothetical protein